MSGYETEELSRIEAALDDLASPTSEDVWQATRPFDERAIASVAATRAGGGSQLVPIGPFIVNFDDIADETSVSAFAFHLADLAAGSVVIRAWAFVKIPFLDIGGAQTTLTMNTILAKPGEIISGGWTLSDHDSDQRGADYTGDGNGTEEPSGSVWPLVGWTDAPGVLGLLFAGVLAQADLVSGQAVAGALVWTP